jgi:chromate transporter
MRPTRAIPILLLAVTVLCAALDAPNRRGAAWGFVGFVLAGALLCVLWPRGRRARGAGPAPTTLDLLRAGLVLGFTGFGGGLAVLTQVEHRLVGRERWITPAVFLESTALGQSLPGAISANTLGFAGWHLARWRGALALEGGFVLPSFLMMVAFSLLYAGLRQFVVVAGIFHLLNPAVAGMVGAMAMKLAAELVRTPAGAPAGLRGLVRDPAALFVALGAAIGVAVLGLGVPEVLLAAGLFGVVRHLVRSPGALPALLPWSLGGLGLAVATQGPARLAVLDELHRLGELATVFLRAGALTFGGGYVIVPVLEAELVQGRHWLTPQAFVDAMALGQVTPGPVVITATFVGYTLAGLTGALVSTVAVFLPAFVFVVLVSLSLDRFRRSPGIQAFLRGLQPAVVGLMAAATATLVRHGVLDGPGAVVAGAAFLLVWKLRVNPMWVVLGAGALGAAWALLPRV